MCQIKMFNISNKPSELGHKNISHAVFQGLIMCPTQCPHSEVFLSVAIPSYNGPVLKYTGKWILGSLV